MLQEMVVGRVNKSLIQ